MAAARPRLAVTLGDPRGIGAEVIRKALAAPLEARLTLIGPDDLVQAIARQASPVDWLGTGEWGQGMGHLSEAERARLAGRHAGLAVERASELAGAGDVDAIVTAPLHKAALRAAGYSYPGQTEFLAHLAGGREVAMMMVAPALRVVLVTTHLPLRDVPAAVTAERIARVARVTRGGLARWFGMEAPRLALCALNPHAGDEGLFGTEDSDVLAPAAREAELAGPLPADTVFVRALRGEFDAVLVPAHDVGMTAIKVAAFGQAVNVTLGLPFPRTAPDHGTALDIAGRGVADAGSMRRALEMATAMIVSGRAAPATAKEA
jgi:4-hydroxythreonine-4-phosphate dehydrogenase